MIELKNVTKIYRSKKATDTKAIDEVSLNIGDKGLTFIVGTSGSGKSTLLNVIGALDSITSGTLLVDGKDIGGLSSDELSKYRNSYVGFVFQDYNLIDEYSVFENINLSLSLQGISDDEKILNTLEDVGLKNLAKRNINELSGGQKQRVAVARALVKDPRIILADEPTGNLDSKSSVQIIELLKKISNERQVIVISHNMNLAKKYGDRIIEIKDGKVSNDTKNEEIKKTNNKIDYKDSKLPFKEIIRLSLLNIKAKTTKTILMVLLTSLSLAFIAFTFNIFMFDSKELALDTIINNDEYTFDIEYKNCIRDGMVYNCENKFLDGLQLKDIDDTITPYKKNIFYELYDENKIVSFQYGNYIDRENGSLVIKDERTLRFVEITDDILLNDVVGSIPKNKDEIVITKKLFDSFSKKGVLTSEGKLYKPKSIDELLSSKKLIRLNSKNIKVVGVIDELNDEDDEQNRSYDYVYVKGFVQDNEFTNDKNVLFNFIDFNYQENHEIGKNAKFIDNEVRYIDNEGIKSTKMLNEDEIIISIDDLSAFYYKVNEEFLEFQTLHKDMKYNEALEVYLNDLLSRLNNIVGRNISYSSSIDIKEKRGNVKIIGISLDSNTYISSSLSEISTLPIKNILGIKTYIDKKSTIKNLLDKYEIRANPQRAGDLTTIYYKHQMQVDSTSSMYKTIRLIVSIVTCLFIIFTTILIINYVHSTINYAKKNIGILKSMGTSSNDIAKIFIFEFLIIDIISSILAILLLILVNRVLNNSIGTVSGYIFNYIIVSPYTILFVPLFTIIFTVLLVTGEINEVCNMKPIDAILDK